MNIHKYIIFYFFIDFLNVRISAQYNVALGVAQAMKPVNFAERMAGRLPLRAWIKIHLGRQIQSLAAFQ